MGSFSDQSRVPRLALILCASLLISCAVLSCGDDSPTKPTDNPYFSSLPMQRTAWQLSSRPESVSHGVHRGRLLWHLPYYLPLRSEVYGDSAQAGEGEVRLLRVVYRPSYQVFEFGGVIDTIFYPSWAGIMLETNKIFDTAWKYLEIRCYAPHGRMHFELGRIDEDVNGDGESFGEDDPPLGDGNGAVSEAEDIGLDGLADQDEPGYDPDRNVDPSRDNWYFRNEGKCPYPPSICGSGSFQARMEDPGDPLYFEFLNGTEGNSLDVATFGNPDQERMIGYFDTDNHYYSYVLDFTDHPDSFYVDDSDINGWRTYRIPLLDPEDVVGNNFDWSRLTHARVWFESDDNATGFDTVLIAHWRFTE
ncbi:hypothetical protein KQH82_07855 [bacterium]|nr:hypothetical protein [bacterium]